MNYHQDFMRYDYVLRELSKGHFMILRNEIHRSKWRDTDENESKIAERTTIAHLVQEESGFWATYMRRVNGDGMTRYLRIGGFGGLVRTRDLACIAVQDYDRDALEAAAKHRAQAGTPQTIASVAALMAANSPLKPPVTHAKTINRRWA